MDVDVRETDPMVFLKEVVDSQRRRKERISEAVIPWLKSKKIPTSKDVRCQINSTMGEHRQYLLRHHAYWGEWQLRLGFESLTEAAHQAYVDICRHDAALGSLAKRRDFQDNVDHTVGYAAQKDVVAYCSLVIGVRDTLCELAKVRADLELEIDETKTEVFDSEISQFIRELRNNLLHGRVVVPQWSIRFEGQTSSGSMRYTAKELLAVELLQPGCWEESKAYLLSIGDETRALSAIVGEHFELLRELAQKIRDLFARNVTDAERDFFEIEDSYRRIGRRQWTSIFVRQGRKDKNPYEYLHRFFDPETVRAIRRLPQHSKEQVDFMIAMKTVEVDFDDELRTLLYEIFDVPGYSSA